MIRLAEIRDIPSIISMLREYAQINELKYSKSGFSSRRTANLLSKCVKQGLVWVSEEDTLNGVLVAQVELNMFSDTVKESHLLVIYVTPECRNGTIGGRMLIAYDKETKARDITMSWIGARANSELQGKSLEKLGYYLQEQFYLKER